MTGNEPTPMRPNFDLIGPRSSDIQLSPNELARYSRHLILPEVGMDGQRKLKAARVLCVGAGGLGMFIFRGVSMLDNRLILAGAIPAAALALLADFGLGAIDKWLIRGNQG